MSSSFRRAVTSKSLAFRWPFGSTGAPAEATRPGRRRTPSRTPVPACHPLTELAGRIEFTDISLKREQCEILEPFKREPASSAFRPSGRRHKGTAIEPLSLRARLKGSAHALSRQNSPCFYLSRLRSGIRPGGAACPSWQVPENPPSSRLGKTEQRPANLIRRSTRHAT